MQNEKFKFFFLLFLLTSSAIAQNVLKINEARIFPYEIATLYDMEPTDSLIRQATFSNLAINASSGINSRKVIKLRFVEIAPSGTEKISQTRFENQANMLNEAFSGRLASRSGSKSPDSAITFCLQKDGLQGLNFEGTIRIKDLSILDEMLKHQSLPLDEILVILIDLESNEAGYASHEYGSVVHNAIYINTKFFAGNNTRYYNEGRTLVHMMGRFLGLQPLWGMSLCADDGLADTPIHNAPNYRCYDSGHMSTCAYATKELTNNFMDAIPDACMNSFTQEQINKMRACLRDNPLRNKFLQKSQNCD